MQETIEQMSTQLNDRWNELPKNRKIQLGFGAGVLIVTLIIAIFLFTRPKMALLYSQNLDTKQIAEVVGVLDGQKIPYTLVNNGSNVEVAEDQLNTAKIALATENVPKGGYTFADAMNNTMSTTESEREAKMQQLTEVNLENMLMSMDAIDSADVSLVIPEQKNSFIASKETSSASVLLTLNTPQSTKQMEAIARLVSSSVTNLDMRNINIMDTEGNPLYIGGDEGSLTTNKQQELKLAAETDIRQKVEQLLTPIYDEVRISPNLILDFSQYEEVREAYEPQDTGKGLPSRESSQATSSTNGPATGQPGIQTNPPQYQTASQTTSESESETTEVEYVNNKVVSNAVKNVGDIDYKQSSLAVNVFNEVVYNEADYTGPLSWADFKTQTQAAAPVVAAVNVVDVVKKGTGIDDVVVYEHEKLVFVDEEITPLTWKDFLPYVLMLLIFIIVVLVIMRFRKQDDIVETEPELEIEEMLSVAREDLQLEEIELKETLETKRQIEKFVDEKPEAVANLLRNWLNEDDWG